MSATMLSMDYAYVDNLSPDQLLEDDLVEIDGEIVQIISIASVKDGVVLTYENEFGEKDTQEFHDNTIFKLYVMQ